MHVAIAIVGYRNPEDVAACLRALARSDSRDFEVVICENGGPAACTALVAAVEKILPPPHKLSVIAASSNEGYAAGVNVCISAAPDADAWWVLNPDTEPDPGALASLIGALNEGWDAVGGTVHFPDGRVEARGGRWNPWLARATAIDYGRPLKDRTRPPTPFEVDYLSGACMLVGRSFVSRVGLMREDYFLYGEEIEWCLRARKLGLRLAVAPAAEVMHRQGTTTGSVRSQSQRGRMPVYLDERNKLLITRDQAPRRLMVTAMGALLMLFLRFGRRGAWRQLGYALNGWWRGLWNERGKPAWVAN